MILPSAPSSLNTNDSAICKGGSTTLSQTGGSLGTGASWNWYSDASFTNLVGTSTDADANITVNPAVTTTYYLRAESTTGAPCTANLEAGSITITVNDPVEITTQPESSQTICAGFPVTFSVEAIGTGITYEWQKDGNPIGVTTATYTINNTASTDAGIYTVIVKGSAPCGDITSSNAELIVNQDIIIDTQPPASTALCEGEDFTLSVVASGTIFSYQWRKDNIPISDDGTNGSTTPNLILNNLASGDSGSYDVVISSPDGTCSQIISNPAVVSVSPPPSVEAGSNLTACSTAGSINIGENAQANNYSSLEWSTTGTGSFGDKSQLVTTYIPGNGETGNIILTLTAQGNATCTEVSDQIQLNITPAPIIDSFSYSASEFCISDNSPKSPTISGKNNYSPGSFSYTYNDSGSGTLNLDSDTGEITPEGSTVGSYTITYTTNDDGICTPISKSIDVTINPLPTPDFSYSGSPFCSNAADPLPTMATDAEKGIFESTSGLVFVDNTTGEIDISASSPGTYDVTNTIAAAGGCKEVSATSKVIITKKPIAEFSYEGSPYCTNGSNPKVTLITNAEHGVYSSTAGLVFADTSTGEININASTPGTYTVTNTIAAANGCDEVTATADVTITKLPIADFSYEDSPYCSNSNNPLVTLATGAEHGEYSSTAGLVFADSSTGEINIDASSPGTYEVTNKIVTAEGCQEVTYKADVTITKLPIADFSYEGSPYCSNSDNPVVTLATGAENGEYSSTTGLVFADNQPVKLT